MDNSYMNNGLPINAMPGTHTSSTTGASYQGQIFSNEDLRKIMNGIREMFQLEEEQGLVDESMEDGDEDPPVDLIDQERRMLRLKALLPTLAQLWWSNSENMDMAAELLADGSRDRE